MNDSRSTMPLPLHHTDPRAPQPKRRTTVIVAIVAFIVLACAIGGWYLLRTAPGSDAVPTRPATFTPVVAVTDTLAKAPLGTRVKLRVVNASEARGAAKRATLVLRDLGYDVVEFDAERALRRDTTVILMHTGHDDWGKRLQRAMSGAAIEPSTDSSHYVDFTVLLGRDWKSPTQPLRP